MTTITQFVTNLGDVSITGVVRAYNEPPVVLNSSDLPALWVQFPVADEPMMTFRAHGGWKELRAQLVVAFEAVGQSTQVANFAGTVALMDNIATALRAAVGTVCAGPLTWSIRQGIVTVGELTYWAAIADVIGNG